MTDDNKYMSMPFNSLVELDDGGPRSRSRSARAFFRETASRPTERRAGVFCVMPQ